MKTFQPILDFTPQGITISAFLSLSAALRRDPNPSPELTPLVVFAAFAVEGYINFVGSRHIDFWDRLDRLPWKSKVEILHSHAKQVPDWGREPLQFAAEIFHIRDRLAHGKGERVLGPELADEREAQEFQSHTPLLPPWYAKINREWAEGLRDRLRALLAHLGRLYGLDENDHQLHSRGGVIPHDRPDPA